MPVYTNNKVQPVTQLFLSCIILLLIACNNQAGSIEKNTTDTTNHQQPADQQQYTVSTLTADSANVYSNLFTDSSELQKFITRQHIENLVADKIRRLYASRNYQFAWFNDSGFTEQALAFRSLYDYDKDSATKRTTLDNRLDELVNSDSLRPQTSDPHIVSTEFMMSWRLMNYLSKKSPDAAADPATLNALLPYQKQTTADWITFMDHSPPTIAKENPWLGRMQKALAELVALQNKGGWDSLPRPRNPVASKKPSAFLASLKKRLFITGQLKQADTTKVYTPELAAAVKTAQAQFGFLHDSTITMRLIKALNVPIAKRIQQVIANMVRMQWMPGIPSGNYILLNIPAYRLYVMNGKDINWGMDVITGKEGHATVMFSGNLDQIVFSPYWNIPSSIVEKEILPKLQHDKNYLQENDMEMKGTRNGLPVIRQLPGEKNELGKIKFLFPNSQHIYFHDTPHKWLFNKDLRAYSHGCIRLAEPEKLAAFLLAGDDSWTTEKIDSAMNSGKEKYVALAKPVPVLIYYFTAWVDDDGILQYRNDMYGHDTELASRLFR